MSADRISVQQGSKNMIGNFTVNSMSEYAIIEFPEPLLPAPALPPVLTINFSYPLLSDAAGLAKNTYKDDVSGESRDLVVSYFWPTGARYAFPSFDDPREETPFQVTLITPPSPVVALFNTPERSQYQREDGKIVHVYERSPPLPTSNLAIVIGELVSSNKTCDTDFGSSPVASWGVPGTESKLFTSMNDSCSAMQYFSRLFQQPLPTAKFDQVAIPGFSKSGLSATEGLGLVLYNQPQMLSDPKQGNATSLLALARLVSHEVAHQWLGETVSTDRWLLEGLTIYLSNLAAEAMLPPDMNPFPSFFTTTTVPGMDADQLPSSLALLNTTSRIVTIGQLASDSGKVVYTKSAAILRMLITYLNRNSESGGNFDESKLRLGRKMPGKEGSSLTSSFASASMPETSSSDADAFVKGVAAYLRDHEYENTSPQVLFDAISRTAGDNVDVGSWLSSWINQPGYPIIYAERAPSNSQQLVLTQRPVDGSKCGDGNRATRPWWVPVSYITQSKPNTVQWAVMNSTCQISIPVARKDWVLINPGRTGYYQTNYSVPIWRDLIMAARSGRLSDTDLAGLLYDARPYALNGMRDQPMALFLELSQALSQRLAAAPWAVATNTLRYMIRFVEMAAAADRTYRKCSADANEYVNKLVADARSEYSGAESNAQYTWTPRSTDSFQELNARPWVLYAGMEANNAAIQANAAALVKSGAALDLPTNLRNPVLRGAALSGDMDAWDQLRTWYQDNTELDEDERPDILSAMYSGSTANMTHQALSYLLSDMVPAEVLPDRLVVQSQTSPEAQNATWEWLDQNLYNVAGKLMAADLDVSSTLGYALLRMTAYVHSAQMQAVVNAFADKYGLPNLKQSAAYNKLLNNEILSYFYKDGCEWLARNQAIQDNAMYYSMFGWRKH